MCIFIRFAFTTIARDPKVGTDRGSQLALKGQKLTKQKKNNAQICR